MAVPEGRRNAPNLAQVVGHIVGQKVGKHALQDDDGGTLIGSG
jgi:hypothetical protein